jgi:hypothetical protein
MRASIDGSSWRFWFRYLAEGTTALPDRKITRCQLASETAPTFVLAEGLAYLHPKDRFEREAGRKLALSRALRAAGFDKPYRAAFWQAYLGRKQKNAGADTLHLSDLAFKKEQI